MEGEGRRRGQIPQAQGYWQNPAPYAKGQDNENLLESLPLARVETGNQRRKRQVSDMSFTSCFFHTSPTRSWVYTCPGEFSDEELKEEVIAIRFASSESTCSTPKILFFWGVNDSVVSSFMLMLVLF